MSSTAKEDTKEPEADTPNVDKAENKADHSTESDEQEPEGTVGLIKEDGDINWDCPCLGGMAKGPCGTEFRAAFSCFHYSQAEPKGSDCYNEFLAMQECMAKFPDIFKPEKEDEDNPLVDEFDDKIKSETMPETSTDKDSKVSESSDALLDNVQASKQ